MISISKILPDGTVIEISGHNWTEFCRNVSDALQEDESDRVLDAFASLATPDEVPA